VGCGSGLPVAGFEAFELLQTSVEGAAGGVDPLLKLGERAVAFLQSTGAGIDVVRAAVVVMVPERAVGIGEAAQVPLAEDDLIEEAARLGGSGNGWRSIRPSVRRVRCDLPT
jgi:hypothetical protein